MRNPCLLLALGLLISSLNCSLADPFIQASSTSLEPETELRLHFDKAVATNEEKGKAASLPLSFHPPTAHQVIWESPKVARILFDQAPSPATTYTLSLANGIRHADGSLVPPMADFEIRSPGLVLEYGTRISPYQQGLRQHEYYLRFNLPVEASKNLKHFYYQSRSKQRVAARVRQARTEELNSSYYVRPHWLQRFDEHRTNQQENSPSKSILENGLIITPATPLPVGDDWTLMLDGGIVDQVYGIQLKTQIGRRIGNISPLKLNSADAVVLLDTPRTLTLDFNHPLADFSSEQLASLIQLQPRLEKAKFEVDGRIIRIHGNFAKLSQTFKVSIDSSLSSADGLTLTDAVEKEVTFQPLQAQLTLPGYDHALFAKGGRAHELLAVNISDCDIRIKALSTDELPLALQAYRHYKNDGPHHEEVMNGVALPYELIPGKEVWHEEHAFDQDIDTSKYLKLDWDKITAASRGVGCYFVQLSGRGKVNHRRVVTQSIVQITDIGLAWKFTEKEALVYTYSCASGEALPGTELRLCGANGKISRRATSGSDGTARFARSDDDYYLVASRNGESFGCAFHGRLESVAMWRFPVRYSWHDQPDLERRLFLFSDRSLYQPGETARFKGLLRDLAGNDIQMCGDRSAELTISDSRQRPLVEKTIKFSENGSFDESFTIPEGSLGLYQLRVHFPRPDDQPEPTEWYQRWVDEQSRTFDHHFNVGKFRRNAFEVLATASSVNPGDEAFDISVKANYYQGQALADASLDWFQNTQQVGFYPAKYRDFYFGDHSQYDPGYWLHYFGYRGSTSTSRTSQFENGESTLSADGEAELQLKIPKFDFPMPVEISVAHTVTDSRDQSISKKVNFTVHPVDTYIGLQRVDSLIHVGDALRMPLVAVDPAGQALRNPLNVEVTIFREWEEKTAVLNDQGQKMVKNETQREQVYASKITVVPNQAASVDFSPTQSGDHFLELKAHDSAGRETRTTVKLSVFGDDDYPWAYENGMRIKLVPESTRYLPGQTARILVQTPIEGNALVTVERDKVLRSFVTQLTTDKPLIEVPIEAADAPNVFISVMVIRGADSSLKQAKEPELKLGYCEILVDNQRDQLRIDFTEPSGSKRPGESVTLGGRVLDYQGRPVPAAEVVLYAEDEGVLSVMGYENPDPMAYFYEPRFLRVNAGTSLSHFLSEDPANRDFSNKGFFVGGGGDAFNGGVEKETRNNFDPCAVWAPRLKTDQQGRFEVTYQSPDTLTRYRVIAVASAGARRFGSDTQDLTIQQPIMLEPAAPRFASQGDVLSAKAVLFNTSDFTGSWEVKLETSSNCQLISDGGQHPEIQQVTLAPGERATVTMRAQFLNTGQAKWTWSARPISIEGTTLSSSLTRDLSDQLEESFEVSYPMPLLRDRSVTRHAPNDPPSSFGAKLDTELLAGRGELHVEIADSQLVRSRHLSEELLSYPYGCVEQTASAMIPWLVAEDLARYAPELAKRSREEGPEVLAKGVQKLLSTQTSSGGLGYWPGSDEATPWASSYAALILVQATQRGIAVPQGALDSLLDYLQSGLKEIPQDSWQAEHQARALWALALAGRPDSAYQNKLLESPTLLGAGGRSMLAMAIAHSNVANAAEQVAKLVAQKYPEVDSCWWVQRHPHHAMKLLALCAIKAPDEQIQETLSKVLDDCDSDQFWGTTWANSWTLQALAAVARLEQSGNSPINFQITHSGTSQQHQLKEASPSESFTIKLSGTQQELPTLHQVDAPLFCLAEVAAKPVISQTPAKLGSSGISLTRNYQRMLADGSTEALESPKVGDLILVTLTLQVPDRQAYLVVDDPIPAAFEIIDENFASQAAGQDTLRAGSWRVDHRELRDDRAVFFFNSIQTQGTETIQYLARITRAGQCIAPAAKAEPMYQPDRVALSPAEQLIITER